MIDFQALAQSQYFFAFIGVVSIWELIWKGIGFWKSARNSQKIWFIAILVFNTAGILPIVYLLFFQKKKGSKKVSKKKKK